MTRSKTARNLLSVLNNHESIFEKFGGYHSVEWSIYRLADAHLIGLFPRYADEILIAAEIADSLKLSGEDIP